MKEFAIYIDDSGSPKPNPKDSTPYFALGGVLVERANNEVIDEAVKSFKVQWNIPLETPLHGSEIRSKKGSFRWLEELPDAQQQRFYDDLTKCIVSCPMVINACVVSRQGYCDRYLAKYGVDTWNMMKSAFSILLERTAKFVARRDGKLMVYYERAGKTENRLLEETFRALRFAGHPFDANNANKYAPLNAEELRARLTGIEGKTKKNHIMQLADLCLYPAARGKVDSNNRALSAMRANNMLLDNYLDVALLPTEGIKYFYFD